jgi:8-oxo-dGTP pyrophosphatase MutT (NUDIX family)
VAARVPQAGAIAFRTNGDRLTVLLVRSKKDPVVWVFPKGHIDDGETPEETAARETWEEAGVKGTLGPRVGAPLEFESGRETVSVQYYVLRATEDKRSPEGRDKQWLTIEDALETLVYESAREKLRQAVALLTADRSER